MMLENLEQAIDEKYEKNVVIGAEMEIYVIDTYNDRFELLNDDEVIEAIYSEFDERVYRDYYNYQLEIRTYPSDDWKEVANELIELMREVSRVAEGRDCIIAPVSYINGGMFNGFHVHVSYKPEVSFGKLVEHALAMYPFMLDITRITLSAPIRSGEYGEILSFRQLDSPHIGVPPLDFNNYDFEYYWTYDENARNGNRYHDIIINTNKKHGRHRIKSVDTIEVRMFDCVGSEPGIKCVLESVYKIAKYINPEWFNRFRHNFVLMVKLKELIRNSKIMLVSPRDWINPITLISLNELLSHLGVENRLNTAWIYHTYINIYEIIYPYYHVNRTYPTP